MKINECRCRRLDLLNCNKSFWSFRFCFIRSKGTCKIRFLEIVAFEVLGCLGFFTEKVSGMIYEGLMGWIFTDVCLCLLISIFAPVFLRLVYC